MSVAEVGSMAMAKLLVVMFEDIRATWQDVSKEDSLEKKIFIVTGSRRVGDDGRHVDQGSPC